MESKKVFAIIFHGKERYKINIEKAYSNVIRNCGFFVVNKMKRDGYFKLQKENGKENGLTGQLRSRLRSTR